MTTGTVEQYAEHTGRSLWSIRRLAYRNKLACERRGRLRIIDFEKSDVLLEAIKRGRTGRREPEPYSKPERKPRERKTGAPAEIDETLRRLAQRDEIIAQRLIDAPDLSARRSLWYHVPLAWQARVIATFRELVTRQFGDDGWKRVSLIEQMRMIAPLPRPSPARGEGARA